MFIRHLIDPFLTFTVVDGAAGGEVAPAAEPAPTESAPESAPAAETAPPADPAPVAPANIFDPTFDPDAALPDDAPYKNAKELREQVTHARQEYAPFAGALADAPPETREALLATAPGYGLAQIDPSVTADLAVITASYPDFDVESRDVVRQAMEMSRTDPTTVIAWVKEQAAALRGDAGPPAGAGGGVETPESALDALGFELDDPQRPMTIAERDEWWAGVQAEQAQAAAVASYQQQYLARVQSELTGLGYDLAAAEGTPERAKADFVVEQMRRNPNGTAQQAHEQWVKLEQGIIDQYAKGLLPNGSPRPLPPAGGAPPSGARELTTLEEMDAAAAERVQQL